LEIFVLEGSDGLAGTGLPSWVGNLTNLEALWISFIDFGGALPDLSGLTKLQFFMTSKNHFTGDFPDYVIDGTMPDINMCSMAWNDFTGTLPEFGTGVSLTMFTVTGNSLHGEIPSSITGQTKIINLGLGWNEFSGEFPSDLTDLGQLRFIYANDNNFTGTLPRLDTTNDALNFVYFQNNEMSGQIPVSLADIANLPLIGNSDLNISGNNFSKSDLQPLIDALKVKNGLDILNYQK